MGRMTLNLKICKESKALASKILEKIGRILEAPESLMVSFKRLTRSLFSSQAITFPFPLIRAARCTVLFPGAEQASRTFIENQK